MINDFEGYRKAVGEAASLVDELDRIDTLSLIGSNLDRLIMIEGYKKYLKEKLKRL